MKTPDIESKKAHAETQKDHKVETDIKIEDSDRTSLETEMPTLKDDIQTLYSKMQGHNSQVLFTFKAFADHDRTHVLVNL